VSGLLGQLLLYGSATIAAGAPATVPWRLAARPTDDPARRPHAGIVWLLAGLLPLGLVSILALLAQVPDQAVDAGLLPISHTLPGRLLALLFPLVLAAVIVLALGAERVDPLAWRLAAVLGILLAGAAAWFLERLRAAAGTPASGWPWLVLIACRWIWVITAGEVVAPGRTRWAPWAALALAPWVICLPEPVRGSVWPLTSLTVGAAAVALLAARWVPPSLRRPVLAVGVLLLAALWVEAARISASFGAP
jgi:hypothetical protein